MVQVQSGNKQSIKHKLLLSIFVIFLVLVLQGCAVQNQDNQPLRVGIILPLSGNFASYGIESQQGILLAFEEFQKQDKNGNVNFPVELYFEDHQGDQKLAVTAYQKLRSNNISLLITGMSPVSLALKPLAEQDEIVQMAMFSSTPSYTSSNDYSFRVTARAEVEDTILAKSIIDKYQKVAVMHINNDMGLGHKKGFVGAFSSFGGSIVAEEAYGAKDTDFRAVLVKIKDTNPEALFIAGDTKTTAYIIKQMKELQMNMPVYATRAVESDELLAIAGDAAEGLIYTYPIDFVIDFVSQNQSGQKNILLEQFAANYKMRHNKIPTAYSAEGYEALRLLLFASKECANNVCVKQRLLSFQQIPSLFGKLSFDENGDVWYEFFLKKVENGKFVRS
ncbi:penicillin-binding protein activator [Candidatus Woesearchaeota archaeon]|nr:penicillin-binding protein activator [Candidatus Woesearchaeota archaeon]